MQEVFWHWRCDSHLNGIEETTALLWFSERGNTMKAETRSGTQQRCVFPFLIVKNSDSRRHNAPTQTRPEPFVGALQRTSQDWFMVNNCGSILSWSSASLSLTIPYILHGHECMIVCSGVCIRSVWTSTCVDCVLELDLMLACVWD